MITACDNDEPSTDPNAPSTNDMDLRDSSTENTTDLDLSDSGILDMLVPLEDAEITDMAWRFDLAVNEEEYSERAPSVDRLYSGYAERSLGFPLGIGTVGFFPPPGGFTNPFAPSGTDHQHTHLTARALLIAKVHRASPYSGSIPLRCGRILSLTSNVN